MTRRSIPTTHSEALVALNGRTSRVIAHHTRLEALGGGCIGLRLHSTCVVAFKSDGSIVLSTAGWRTRTTQDRINRVIRAHGWSVYVSRFEWHIAHRDGRTFEFEDGFTIEPVADYGTEAA